MSNIGLADLNIGNSSSERLLFESKINLLFYFKAEIAKIGEIISSSSFVLSQRPSWSLIMLYDIFNIEKFFWCSWILTLTFIAIRFFWIRPSSLVSAWLGSIISTSPPVFSLKVIKVSKSHSAPSILIRSMVTPFVLAKVAKRS